MSKGSNYVRLSSGHDMPLVGFGTFRIRGKDLIYSLVDELLKVGYRSIDTAAVYGNESDIGCALEELLPRYNLTRQDIFITTKLGPEDNGDPERIKSAVDKSLRALRCDYIDLYLVHWPGTGRLRDQHNNRQSRRVTWASLVELHKSGLLRSIGVSNYTVAHLQQLMQDNNCYGVKPAVNQVELHPRYRQQQVTTFCEKQGIHVQAYSSLGTSGRYLLSDPEICAIASQVGVTAAKLLLKWALQQGIGILPKAATVGHIAENLDLYCFDIDDAHMKQLSSLGQQEKFAWDPSNVL